MNELQIRSPEYIQKTFLDKEVISSMMTVSKQFIDSGAFSRDVKNVQQGFVKMQYGIEMGMTPMEAMNSLAIINGHLSIYGVAVAKRLRIHGWKIEYLESTEKIAKVKISKEKEEYEYEATEAELKKLNSKAFGFASKDKLKWHALGRLVRFNVPEVLGPISYLAEEAEDIKPIHVDVDVSDFKKSEPKKKEAPIDDAEDAEIIEDNKEPIFEPAAEPEQEEETIEQKPLEKDTEETPVEEVKESAIPKKEKKADKIPLEQLVNTILESKKNKDLERIEKMEQWFEVNKKLYNDSEQLIITRNFK